jgi:hypothetical protein
VALAALAKQGRDKVTIITTPGLEKFSMWAEQLLAESTGKNGRGLVPIVGERVDRKAPIDPAKYGDDRSFVFVLGQVAEHETKWYADSAAALEGTGHPVISLDVPSPDALAGEFFRWEFATAVAGHLLNVNPFDEPDVASAKQKTAETLKRGWATVAPISDLQGAVESLLRQRRRGDYFAISAFVPESDEFSEAMRAFREGITGRTGMATMFGYGPRYLHSTGQIHKGGPDSALILLLVAGDESVSYSDADLRRLFVAQAAGDAAALAKRGGRMAFVRIGGRVAGSDSTTPAAKLQMMTAAWRV